MRLTVTSWQLSSYTQHFVRSSLLFYCSTVQLRTNNINIIIIIPARNDSVKSIILWAEFCKNNFFPDKLIDISLHTVLCTLGIKPSDKKTSGRD